MLGSLPYYVVFMQWKIYFLTGSQVLKRVKEINPTEKKPLNFSRK